MLFLLNSINRSLCVHANAIKVASIFFTFNSLILNDERESGQLQRLSTLRFWVVGDNDIRGTLPTQAVLWLEVAQGLFFKASYSYHTLPEGLSVANWTPNLKYLHHSFVNTWDRLRSHSTKLFHVRSLKDSSTLGFMFVTNFIWYYITYTPPGKKTESVTIKIKHHKQQRCPEVCFQAYQLHRLCLIFHKCADVQNPQQSFVNKVLITFDFSTQTISATLSCLRPWHLTSSYLKQLIPLPSPSFGHRILLFFKSKHNSLRGSNLDLQVSVTEDKISHQAFTSTTKKYHLQKGNFIRISPW